SPPQGGKKWPAAYPYGARRRLLPAGVAMPLSIRWRLTLWNVVALAVVLVGFGGLVYGMLAAALYAQLDRTLAIEREELTQDERLPRDPLPRLRYWVGEFAEDQNSSCVVYGADGRPLLRSERMPEESVPPVPVASEAPQSGSMTLPGIGRQRFLVYRLQFP